MNPTIKELLYLTHDKWKDKVEIKHRTFFKEFLETFLEKKPEILEELTIIVELGQDEDKLVLMKGVMNILKTKYPIEMKSILTNYYSDERKRQLSQKVLGKHPDMIELLNKDVNCSVCGYMFYSDKLTYQYICNKCKEKHKK